MEGFSKRHSGAWRFFRDGDFEEEDVWAVLKEKKVYGPKAEQLNGSSTVTAATRVSYTSVAKMIPKSASGNEAEGIRQQSAPLTIPNWSKIPRKKTNINFGGNDEDGSKIPPHEILARRLAKSQISSFSVLEGVGLKLKQGKGALQSEECSLNKNRFP